MKLSTFFGVIRIFRLAFSKLLHTLYTFSIYAGKCKYHAKNDATMKKAWAVFFHFWNITIPFLTNCNTPPGSALRYHLISSGAKINPHLFDMKRFKPRWTMSFKRFFFLIIWKWKSCLTLSLFHEDLISQTSLHLQGGFYNGSKFHYAIVVLLFVGCISQFVLIWICIKWP